MATYLQNELMSKHTTFRIGGPADLLIIPDNKDEFIEEVKNCICLGQKHYILGNGSNILVNDSGVRATVIKNTKALDYLKISDGLVIAGSSVMLPVFVNFCVNNSLEGLEYLYPIPGTIGGSVYMNAGIGNKVKKSISDKLVYVKIFDGKDEIIINKEQLTFSYRNSIFQSKKNWIILEAAFNLEKQDKDCGISKIEERMKEIKIRQNRNYPNAGTIFKKHYNSITKRLSGLQIGGCKLSGNWISNVNNGSAKDAINIIRVVKFIHFLLFKKCSLEIEIWG